MSASKKKQLHSESTEKLTERQILEQKEAKKVKLYSIGFVVVLVALPLTTFSAPSVHHTSARGREVCNPAVKILASR